MLAVFKYANFFVANVNEGLAAAGIAPLPLLHIVLPIGISFYTFTQIAFLVDCWQGKVHERSFVHYVLFVTYFPHLIAGPGAAPRADDAAVRQPGDLPARRRTSSRSGLAIFAIGLAKKLLIADTHGRSTPT